MKKGKSTEIAKFNSATIPPINKETLAKHLTIGYHANPRTGHFDVSKASIKIKREFLTFLDCIGHIEISATAKAREPKSRKTSPSSPAPVSGAGPLYGAGRGAGQRGGNTAQWRHLAADGGQHTPAGATSTSTVTRTPETWSYPSTTTTATPSSSSTSPAAAASVFTDTFLRMKKPVSSQKPAVVRVSPPFSSAETVELVLGVAPCQEYSLQLRILPLHRSTVLGCQIKVVDYLEEDGAFPEFFGGTPLLQAQEPLQVFSTITGFTGGREVKESPCD